MVSVVVVESPSKIKKVQGYLDSIFGKDRYKVYASLGHIRDLPQKELGVDVNRGFVPRYQVDSKKGKTVKALRDAVSKSKADALYLATDPDREGEAIAWHLIEVVKPHDDIPIYRTPFNAITKDAVEIAFRNPRRLDTDLVDAQEARRILDRLVGYMISPIMWDQLESGLSAGRVQSIGLRFIVERQRERDSFVSRDYYQLSAEFAVPSDERSLIAQLVEWQGRAYGSETFPSIESVEAAQTSMKSEPFTIASLSREDRFKTPEAPFTTSTLQKAASSHLDLSPNDVMQIAQKLYESGSITYMRTDSPTVSSEAAESARRFIVSSLGDDYLPDLPPVYKAKSGNAQEAHECIRPTDVNKLPSELRAEDGAEVYRLIWERFVASQMAPAVYDEEIIQIIAGDGVFQAKGSRLKFDGYQKVYRRGDDEGEVDSSEETLPDSLPPVEKGAKLALIEFIVKKKKTEPPRRYTEAMLVAELEKAGVGRPSTYASIVETIKYRKYITKKGKHLEPTEIGYRVMDFLLMNFADLFDPQFTSGMEESLDEIAVGKVSKQQFLQEFWSFFYPQFERFGNLDDLFQMGKKQEALLESVCDCPKCGKPMVKRSGKNGEFYGCTGYPKCVQTLSLEEVEL